MAAWQEMYEEARRVREREKASGGGGSGAAAELPALCTSPLLLGSDGRLHPASNLRWAANDFQSLPISLQRPMLTALGDSALVLHPAVNEILAEAGANATGGGRYGGGGGGGTTSANAIRKASMLVERLRGEAPAAQQVPLALLTRKLHEAIPSPSPTIVISCARHLFKIHKPELLSHVLVPTRPSNGTATFTLMPTSRACVGAAYGNSQFELLQPSASFVSDLYITAEGRMAARLPVKSAERWRGFLVAAGAAEGLSFVVSAANLPPSQVPSLCVRMPRMWYSLWLERASLHTSSRYRLPSNSRLQRHDYYTLHVTRYWRDGEVNTSAASACVVSASSMDGSEQPTATSCPALAAAIRGTRQTRANRSSSISCG